MNGSKGRGVAVNDLTDRLGLDSRGWLRWAVPVVLIGFLYIVPQLRGNGSFRMGEYEEVLSFLVIAVALNIAMGYGGQYILGITAVSAVGGLVIGLSALRVGGSTWPWCHCSPRWPSPPWPSSGVRRQLRDQGLAILIVEQSVPRALANSSRCYVMERGRIVISGESTTLAQDEHVFAIVRGTEEVPSPARTN